MPSLHRYLGNPVLSASSAGCSSAATIGDFHCGLRGFRRDLVLALDLQTTGMEFASEMVVKATLAKHDDRRGADHARAGRPLAARRTCAPGATAGGTCASCSLLQPALAASSIPGLVVFVLGIVIGAVVIPRPFSIGSVTFDVDTLVAASAMIVIGFQSVLFALFTQVYASAEGFLPEDKRVRHILKTLEPGTRPARRGVLGIAGIVGLAVSLSYWGSTSFGSLDYDHALRIVVPSVTALIVSCQIILGTFFLSILGIRRTRHPAMGALETDEEGREAAPGKVTRTRPDGAVGTVVSTPVLPPRRFPSICPRTVGPRTAAGPMSRPERPWPMPAVCPQARAATCTRPAPTGRNFALSSQRVALGLGHVLANSARPAHPGRTGLAVRQRSPSHRPRLGLRAALRHVQPLPADGGEQGADGERHRRARHPDSGAGRRRGRVGP